MKCERPGSGEVPRALTQLGESATCLKTPPHGYSNAALLWASSSLDMCLSGNTPVFFMLHMRPSQVQRDSTPRNLVFRPHQSSDRWPLVHQAPSSCLPPRLLQVCLTGHCPLPPRECPRGWNIPEGTQKRGASPFIWKWMLRWNVNHFHLQFPKYSLKMSVPTWLSLIFRLSQNFLALTGRDARVLLLFPLVVIVAPSAVLTPFLITFTFSEKKPRAIQRRT